MPSETLQPDALSRGSTPHCLALALLCGPLLHSVCSVALCDGDNLSFHPQIQRLLDRPFRSRGISTGHGDAQVQAALAAVPGTTLDSYELARFSDFCRSGLVIREQEQFRVYVHPQSLPRNSEDQQ